MEDILEYTGELNLLIIDDEPDIIKALTRQFRRLYTVYSTTDPNEGLRIMEQSNIQVVLSDQRMPGMTGVDFFAKIKDKYPEALKLILTGYSDIEAVIGAINEGQVFRYVKKPWNPEELELIIREAFEKHELITRNKKLMLRLRDANLNLEEKVRMRTRELEKANQELIEINKEKNRYIGMVAHDLRNPIGIAESFSTLLLEEIDSISHKQLVDYLNIISERCSFSLNLIHNFLDVAKIEAGIIELIRTEQDYGTFVRESLVHEEFLANNKLQKIVVHCDPCNIMVRFDKNRIQQVLSNLIGNAIKYSHPQTTITIEIIQQQSKVLTKIIDQGQGIPHGEIGNLFQPFRTTSVKSTANEKSTGLGLVIVKKIIEAHKGEFGVDSIEGEGSTFWFSLPVV